MSEMQARLSVTYNLIDKKLKENNALLTNIMEQLAQFKARRSKQLQISLETIKRNLVLQLDQLFEVQGTEMNTEISDVVNACQAFQKTLDDLQLTSSVEISVNLPEQLCNFHEQLIPSMERYRALSHDFAEKHFVDIEKTISEVQQNQNRLLVQWHDTQRSRHDSFINSLLPALLNEGNSTMLTMQAALEENGNRFIQATRGQSEVCRDDVGSIFSELLKRMNLLQNRLSQINTVMGEHRSKVEKKLHSSFLSCLAILLPCVLLSIFFFFCNVYLFSFLLGLSLSFSLLLSFFAYPGQQFDSKLRIHVYV